MSELTKCNYCSMREIVRQAAIENKKILIKEDPKVHFPHGVAIHLLTEENEQLTKDNFESWMGKLPDQCEC